MSDRAIMQQQELSEMVMLRRAIVHAAMERHQFSEWERRSLGEFSKDVARLLADFDIFRTQQVELLKRQVIDLLNVTVRPQIIVAWCYLCDRPKNDCACDNAR